jgi:NMD protein affecting ribosome stability and mRNA decay
MKYELEIPDHIQPELVQALINKLAESIKVSATLVKERDYGIVGQLEATKLRFWLSVRIAPVEKVQLTQAP